MYDYHLGGTDSYEVDRVAVGEMHRVIPELFRTAREDRAFPGHSRSSGPSPCSAMWALRRRRMVDTGGRAS